MPWIYRWELAVAALAVLVPLYIGVKALIDLRKGRWLWASAGLLIALGATTALSIMAQVMFDYHQVHS